METEAMDSRKADRVLTAQMLEREGWQEYSHRPADMAWFKRFPDVVPNCFMNEEKQGMQILVRRFDWETNSSYQVMMVGRCRDGISLELTSYGISEDQFWKELEPQCQKLIRAWIAANEIPKPVESEKPNVTFTSGQSWVDKTGRHVRLLDNTMSDERWFAEVIGMTSAPEIVVLESDLVTLL